MTAWTKDAPNAPGDYWWREREDVAREFWRLLKRDYCGRWWDGPEQMFDFGVRGEWWPGPIPSPEEVAALRDAAKIMGDGMRDLRDRLASERAKAEAWQRVAEDVHESNIQRDGYEMARATYDAAVARHLGGTGT